MIQHPVRGSGLLVVATIPAIVFARAFDIDFSPESLGFEFLITTLILWLADLVGGVSFQTKEVKWYNALVMGVMQALAILPAVSRSGAAISGGVATGLSRKRSTDFAFLSPCPRSGAIRAGAIQKRRAIFAGDGRPDGRWQPLVWASSPARCSGPGDQVHAVHRAPLRRTWFGVYTALLGT